MVGGSRRERRTRRRPSRRVSRTVSLSPPPPRKRLWRLWWWWWWWCCLGRRRWIVEETILVGLCPAHGLPQHDAATRRRRLSSSSTAQPPNNPFAEGCLRHHHHPHQRSGVATTTTGSAQNVVQRRRVCNSDDHDSARWCDPPPWDWEDAVVASLEIRVFPQNWDSAVLLSWVLQIVLSELVGIPTSIEANRPNDRSFNFYYSNDDDDDDRSESEDPASSRQPGVESEADYSTLTTDYFTALENAAILGDCRTRPTPRVQPQSRDGDGSEDGTTANTTNNNDNDNNNDDYVPCAHMVPEVWSTATSPMVQEAVSRGILQVPSALGIVGRETLFVTKFTAMNDPTLDSYLGLQGNENRRKLAETFLRPTTWLDYCQQVSTHNCTEPDKDGAVAQRAPRTDEEGQRYFVPDLYTGHFRATEENDCGAVGNTTTTTTTTTNATTMTCTGHIADYPCGWDSFVEPQAHHLNIALSSNGNEPYSRGYSYSQLLDLWDAANATRSNLISMWWSPNAQFEKYQGQDAEYHPVALPYATQECLQHRVPLDQRCVESTAARLGDPSGTCEIPAIPLRKIVAGGAFQSLLNDPSVHDAIRHPALDVLDKFTISEVQLNAIFDLWASTNNSTGGRTTRRQAVCTWAANNLDYLQSFVPPTYPRVVVEYDNGVGHVLMIVATSLGCVAAILVLVMSYFILYKYPHKMAIKCAQLGFLRLLLCGSFLLSLGAIAIGAPPTNASCILAIWLVNIGYTLELVPLVVKVAAINRLMGQARKLRRVKISRQRLFGTVALICVVAIVFLISWTVLDTPTKLAEYELLTDQVTDDGDTVVARTYFCSTQSFAWPYLAVAWNALLLLCATVLALQTRKLRKDFNESRTLAVLIYSHFVFVMLRVVAILMEGNMKESTLRSTRSLIYSIDTMAALLIYFVPKIMAPSGTEHSSGAGATFNPSFARNSDSTGAGNATSEKSADDAHASEVSRQQSEMPTKSGFVEKEHTAGESVVCSSSNALNNPIQECPQCGYTERKPLLDDDTVGSNRKVESTDG